MLSFFNAYCKTTADIHSHLGEEGKQLFSISLFQVLCSCFAGPSSQQISQSASDYQAATFFFLSAFKKLLINKMEEYPKGYLKKEKKIPFGGMCAIEFQIADFPFTIICQQLVPFLLTSDSKCF